MPRGPVVYSPPAGTVPQLPLTTILSATFNSFVNDVTNTFNTAQPIEYGGTNATNAGAARTSLSAIGVVRRVIFNASGTYTPNANMVYCLVESIGGGGAGGGCVGAASGGASGGGGGSGGYTRSLLTKADIGASKAVTIGAGGSGVSGAIGNAGGTTSLGSLATANGGLGGGVGNAATTSLGTGGAAAAAASLGGELYAGTAGQNGYTAAPGIAVVVSAPNGGSSVLGGGGLGLLNTNGLSGSAPGAGGGGSAAYNNANNRTGGNGANGIVIITEFCTE